MAQQAESVPVLLCLTVRTKFELRQTLSHTSWKSRQVNFKKLPLICGSMGTALGACVCNYLCQCPMCNLLSWATLAFKKIAICDNKLRINRFYQLGAWPR